VRYAIVFSRKNQVTKQAIEQARALLIPGEMEKLRTRQIRSVRLSEIQRIRRMTFHHHATAAPMVTKERPIHEVEWR